MINLLDFLIELASMPHWQSEIDIAFQKQPGEIQHAFRSRNVSLLKYKLSDNKNPDFTNERSVVQI